jgi:hypothetical protein
VKGTSTAVKSGLYETFYGTAIGMVLPNNQGKNRHNETGQADEKFHIAVSRRCILSRNDLFLL